MNLTTTYLGLQLRNPLVASPSPLSSNLDGVRRLAAAGVGAIVLHSLFEEQVRAEQQRLARLLAAGSDSFAESLSYFPPAVEETSEPQRYLSLLERAAAEVDVPVIASLNCVTPSSWIEYAGAMAQAGAAALELNVYYLPADPDIAGRDVEQRHVEILQEVKRTVAIPVAVKLTPYLSSVGAMALALQDAGADGLVLFNRLMAPTIDPERLMVVPGVNLSTAADGRLPQTWIALLRGRLRLSLAATGGVDDAPDVVRLLLAGADVVMSTSALLRHGSRHAATLIDGLCTWMSARGFTSPDEVRGLLAAPGGGDQSDHERSQYVAALRAANASMSSTTH